MAPLDSRYTQVGFNLTPVQVEETDDGKLGKKLACSGVDLNGT